MTTTLTPDLWSASIAAGMTVNARYAVAGRYLARGHQEMARETALWAFADELEERHLRNAWLAERETARAER